MQEIGYMALCPNIEAKKIWDNATKKEKSDIISNVSNNDAKRELKDTHNKSWSEIGKGGRQILNESMEDIGFCLNEFSTARCKKKSKKQA